MGGGEGTEREGGECRSTRGGDKAAGHTTAATLLLQSTSTSSACACAIRGGRWHVCVRRLSRSVGCVPGRYGRSPCLLLPLPPLSLWLLLFAAVSIC
eukprot:scaffold11929_cov107-Isochrysis_galbana.AAC.9